MPEERFEEVQEEFFNILGNIKLLLKRGNNSAAKEYVNEQYEILKNDLFANYHTNE